MQNAPWAKPDMTVVSGTTPQFLHVPRFFPIGNHTPSSQKSLLRESFSPAHDIRWYQITESVPRAPTDQDSFPDFSNHVT